MTKQPLQVEAVVVRPLQHKYIHEQSPDVITYSGVENMRNFYDNFSTNNSQS